MDNVIIRIVCLPAEIHGMTVVDVDGNYNVYLNSKADMESAFMHELKHILNNDFYNEADIKLVEEK